MSDADGVQGRFWKRRRVLGSVGAAGALGLAGCLGSTDSGSDEPITIGHQVDETGPGAHYGFWQGRAVSNYVDWLNDNGGIGGRDVEYVSEDSGTDPDQGIQAMRNLIQEANADFVIGSQFANVNLASLSLAKQLQTPYFTIGNATVITGSEGNRWIFNPNYSVASKQKTLVEWGLENLGKQWTIIFLDYSYGQEMRDFARENLEATDGELLETIPVSFGESDLTSHLNKVPDDTEVLYNVLVGGQVSAFAKQSSDFDVAGDRYGSNELFEGIDLQSIRDQVEGYNATLSLPRDVDQYDTDGHRFFRNDILNQDETDQPPGVLVYAPYETVSWIKRGVESMDWSSPDDHQDFIRWFETEEPTVEESSREFPQGPKFWRGADHQVFHNWFSGTVHDAKFEVDQHTEVTEPSYEPNADLSAQSF